MWRTVLALDQGIVSVGSVHSTKEIPRLGRYLTRSCAPVKFIVCSIRRGIGERAVVPTIIVNEPEMMAFHGRIGVLCAESVGLLCNVLDM